jgi:ATP-binding cassette subfamily B (MDR/TAP) protein 10
VNEVFGLAKKEAYMSGIFWGMSGLTGNLAMLCLLGYGKSSSLWMERIAS